jgi:hypothetical protein
VLLPDYIGNLPKHVAVHIICVYALCVQVVGSRITKLLIRYLQSPRFLQQSFEAETFAAKEEYFYPSEEREF